jgi:hypothetical protein
MTVKENELADKYLDEQVNLPEKQIVPGEIIIGTLTGLDHQGKALVDFSGNIHDRPVSAVSTTSISLQHAGRQVALLFVDNDPEKPIIMGIIHNPLQDILDNFELNAAENELSDVDDAEQEAAKGVLATSKVDDMILDGDRVVFEAKKEIVLKCGEASITLTKAGKILIKGKYLLNRSSGVNRIVGGSVQIN